jgi:hypothetical protein
MKPIIEKTGNSNPGGRSKAIVLRIFAGFFLLFCVIAKGAPFQNLDFESSPLLPPGDYSYPFTIYANALPGWTVHVGDTIQNDAWGNEYMLDAPGVALMTWPGNPLDGQKSVYLQSTFSAPTYVPGAHAINVSIAQVGLVPAGSRWLRFTSLNQWYDSFPIPPGPFDVKLGGTSLSLFPLFSNAGYVVYAADVSPWAGLTSELSIGVLASAAWGNPSFPEGWAFVDSIIFSRTLIPEPSVAALIGIGSFALLLLRRPPMIKLY